LVGPISTCWAKIRTQAHPRRWPGGCFHQARVYHVILDTTCPPYSVVKEGPVRPERLMLTLVNK